MTTISELERISAFVADIEDRAAQRFEPVLGGMALFDDRVPDVHMANHLRLDPAANLSAAQVAAEAERVQESACLGHRRITIHDDVAGRRLAPGLCALGWHVQRLAVMVLRHAPAAPVATGAVRELRDGSWRPFRKQMLEGDDVEPETIRQIDEAIQTLARAVGSRTFGAIVEGVIASGCDLFSDGRIAQVEAVFTLKPYRNQGLARAVIWRAVEEARSEDHDLIFLIAADDDWPKGLYDRLGFEEIGYFFEFSKTDVRPPRREANA
ncbi:MAG: GNAT family N-acetyltransferase [Actinomycetota bacterium]|nr:GNAT family N-acetyltransferase [Actinomycetota bacterium]